MLSRQSIRTAAAAIAAVMIVVVTGCAAPGEMGVARFEIGGGTSPADSWDPTTPLAVNTRFTVRAHLDDGEDDAARRCGLFSADEAVIAPAEPDASPGERAGFVALDAGIAAIELIDLDSGALLDQLVLTVDEADALDVRLAGGRSAPPSFAMVEDTVVAAAVDLSDRLGEGLNHYDVAEGESPDLAIVEVTTGGDVVKFQAGEAGQAAVAVLAADQPAATDHDISVVREVDVDQLSLRVEGTCADGQARVVAEFTTADGLAVLGLPVTWSVEGAERFDVLDDTLVLTCDELDAVSIRAEGAGLTGSTDLSPGAAGAAGASCAVGSRGSAPAGGLACLLLLVAAVRRRAC